eukprot:2871447-Prymnesium_polylepis.1
MKLRASSNGHVLKNRSDSMNRFSSVGEWPKPSCSGTMHATGMAHAVSATRSCLSCGRAAAT